MPSPSSHPSSLTPDPVAPRPRPGFFDESSQYASADPTDGNKWGPRSGQDFVANHASADIDYAVIHMWPDNWAVVNEGIAFGQNWMQSHLSAVASLSKPMIVEGEALWRRAHSGRGCNRRDGQCWTRGAASLRGSRAMAQGSGLRDSHRPGGAMLSMLGFLSAPPPPPRPHDPPSPASQTS